MSLKSQVIAIAVWVKTYSHVLRIIGGFSFFLAIVSGIFWLCGSDVEPITYMYGLLAPMFLGAPSIAKYIVPNRKPIYRMSGEEILNFIRSTDPENDWKRVSTSLGVEHYLLEDPRLRFRCRSDESGIHRENFNEAWATKQPDPHATSYWHYLYYDSSLIDRYVMVTVDGARADIPMPSILSPSHEITKLQYHVAQIYDYCGLLDEHLERCGLKVSQSDE